MKAGNGDHFEQAYNAQAAVDTETYLIIGQLVTDAPNDKQQLNPVLERISAEVAKPKNVLADTGYYSEDAIQKAEADDGPSVYCAMAKSGHPLSVADLEKQPIAFPPPPGAPVREQRAHRLNTPEGKALYKQRKQTVEPVFGIIKEVLGFRRFSMRGKEKAETQWSLVCLSYNLKKIFKLAGKCAPKSPVSAAKQRVYAISAQIRAFFGPRTDSRQIFWPVSGNWTWAEVLTPTGC